MFVNGEIQSPLPLTHANSTLSFEGTNTNDFAVGVNPGYGNEQFSGEISKVEIYESALTAEEVASSYNENAQTYGVSPITVPVGETIMTINDVDGGTINLSSITNPDIGSADSNVGSVDKKLN